MKIKYPFFKKNNNINLEDIYKILNLNKPKKNFKIDNISDLNDAKKNDLSFFNSLKYIDSLKLTKSKNIITHKKYEKIVNEYSNPIVVNNVLNAVAAITELFYPASINDNIDFSKRPNLSSFGLFLRKSSTAFLAKFPPSKFNSYAKSWHL